jgi:hypothetical protein
MKISNGCSWAVSRGPDRHRQEPYCHRDRRQLRAHGARVRFFTAVDLVNQLEAEGRAGKSGKLADQLVRVDLVILDLCAARSYVEWRGIGLGRAGF